MSTARGKARRALQEGRAAVAKKKTDTRGHATRGRLDILDDIKVTAMVSMHEAPGHRHRWAMRLHISQSDSNSRLK